jgi:hypothetical protein
MEVDNLFFQFYRVEILQAKLLHIKLLIFLKNLTMNRGGLTWVEIFWSYNAKVIDY